MQSTQTASISGRVVQEDLEFLLEFQIPGQTTISEKLRYLFAFFRNYHESLESFADCRQEIERLIAPAQSERLKIEHDLDMHSEIMVSIADSIPSIMALLVTQRLEAKGADSKQQLLDFERKLLQEAVRLIERLLRLALTPRTTAYRGDVLHKELKPVIELVEILKLTHQTK